jgi:hypothetical protein
MADSAVWAGKNMGGKKGDGFSCLHSPANGPFTPFCRSIEFQGMIGRRMALSDHFRDKTAEARPLPSL